MVALIAAKALELIAFVDQLMAGLHVHGQVALSAKQLVTDAALMSCLLVGGPQVEVEVILRGKLHAACFALELSILASVGIAKGQGVSINQQLR